MLNHKAGKIVTILTIVGMAATSCGPKPPAESGRRVAKATVQGTTMFITVKAGLNLRTEPSETGKRLALIPYGEKVQKIEVPALEPAKRKVRSKFAGMIINAVVQK